MYDQPNPLWYHHWYVHNRPKDQLSHLFDDPVAKALLLLKLVLALDPDGRRVQGEGKDRIPM